MQTESSKFSPETLLSLALSSYLIHGQSYTLQVSSSLFFSISLNTLKHSCFIVCLITPIFVVFVGSLSVVSCPQWFLCVSASGSLVFCAGYCIWKIISRNNVNSGWMYFFPWTGFKFVPASSYLIPQLMWTLPLNFYFPSHKTPSLSWENENSRFCVRQIASGWKWFCVHLPSWVLVWPVISYYLLSSLWLLEKCLLYSSFLVVFSWRVVQIAQPAIPRYWKSSSWKPWSMLRHSWSFLSVSTLPVFCPCPFTVLCLWIGLTGMW